MDLQAKKLKVDISTTPTQNSPRSLSSPILQRQITHPPVKGENYENLFPHVLLRVNFFKT